MRKAALITLGAGFVMAGGAFLPALATTTPPPPTYSSPCGSSYETTPAPTSPIPTVENNAVPGGNEYGVFGANGYFELVGGPTQGGTISGYGTDGNPGQNVYGGVSGSATAFSVCFGTGETGVIVQH